MCGTWYGNLQDILRGWGNVERMRGEWEMVKLFVGQSCLDLP
jgi:hypothetical protein